MNVNARSAKKCCKLHDADYGHTKRSRPAKRLARAIKRRDEQLWRKEVGA